MARTRYRPEQTIPMLREAEVEIGKGMTVRDVRRNLKIRQHTGAHKRNAVRLLSNGELVSRQDRPDSNNPTKTELFRTRRPVTQVTTPAAT